MFESELGNHFSIICLELHVYNCSESIFQVIVLDCHP